MKEPEEKIKEIEQFLVSAKDSIHRAQQILQELAKDKVVTGTEKIQGVFDGEKIVNLDGKIFEISPEYAAKSKLVKGDVVEIISDGNYNVVSNAPRKELIGDIRDQGDYFTAEADGNKYKVLNASVSNFGLANGDKVALVIPAEGHSDWAAIEGKINETVSVSEPVAVEPITQAEESAPVENTSSTPEEQKTEVVLDESPTPSNNASIPMGILETPVETVVPVRTPETPEMEQPNVQPEAVTAQAPSSYDQDLANDILDRPSNTATQPAEPVTDQAQGVKELDI